MIIDRLLSKNIKVLTSAITKTCDSRIGGLRIVTYRIATPNNATSGIASITGITWDRLPSVTASFVGDTNANNRISIGTSNATGRIDINWVKSSATALMYIHVQIIGYCTT